MNCTMVRPMIDAGSLAVTRVGSTVALHLATTQGGFIFRLSEKRFVKAARGKVDHNGQPYRSIEEIERTEGEEASPEISNAKSQTPNPEPIAESSPHGSQVSGCERAWQLITADLTLTTEDAAIRAGTTIKAFSTFITRHHAGELATLRRAAGLSLHPQSRRVMNLTTTAAAGAPLMKPKGKIA